MSEKENIYIVFTEIKGASYSVSVKAYSPAGAEHKILDLGIYDSGTHEYTVNNALAFDSDSMKTDSFIGMALNAQTISYDELKNIVDAINKRTKRLIEIEKEIERVDAQIAELEKQISELQKYHRELTSEFLYI